MKAGLTNTPSSSHPNNVVGNEYVFVREWGSAGPGYGQLNSPSSIAVDPTGKVYVLILLRTPSRNFIVTVHSSQSGAILLSRAALRWIS